MKKLVVLSFLICCNITFSQIGKVNLKNSKFKIGEENTYVYEPSKEVSIPEGAKVKIVYHYKADYANVETSLTKKNKIYEFNLKVPDSIRALIVGIYDGKNVIDNNQNKGYDVFLRTATPTETGKGIIDKIQLMSYANSNLNLKLDLKPENILAEYNNLYAKYPITKEDISYMDYLRLKDQLNSDKEQLKPEILEFAQKCEKKNSEEYWLASSRLYGMLKMDDKAKEMENKILAKYPKGQFAKNKFMRDFGEYKDKTEQYVLESLKLYETFNDNSEKPKALFYSALLKIYLANKDFQKTLQYENLLEGRDKLSAAFFYNDLAWSLSGEDLVTPAKDIEFAEKISKRSLDIISNVLKESQSNKGQLQQLYNMCADTYALILYKQNKAEEAFQYLDKINQLGGLDPGAKERYAGMMEKVKGLEFTKKYIETELANGVDSRGLLTQLGAIYKKLNLPLAEFNKIKEKSLADINAKNTAVLIEKYGSTQAIDFNLKNLEGKEVKLSDCKGKVVVLDFWATWCGPCKASFPKMQELVTKYKGKNVEFLFVDTWERSKENSETIKKVTTFINDQKYSFNVVFDFDNSVTKKYKVQGIPTKILINKNGTILSDSVSEQNLINLIDEQLSL